MGREKKSENKTRNIIIGIDGVPYGLMKDLSDRGIMPNFSKLREDGIFKKMESSIPEISSVAWSSIITGKNPGEHGIFGFTDLIEGTYSLSFPNFNSLKAQAFWHTDDKKYVIINVPSTYPAHELNGFLVSGFISPTFEKAIYPSSYVERLKRMNYKIDVDAEKGHKSKMLLLKELSEVLDQRMKLCDYFWSEFNWNVFMIVFTGTDRLEHFLWDAYENEKHEHHIDFLNFFKKIDKAMGKINEKMNEDDSLIILSDHGMGSIKSEVNINTCLVKEGFLKIDNDLKKRYNNIMEDTKAFALDPARIYLNRERNYPKGSVKEEDEDKIINQLVEIFDKLEKDGEKVIKRVYRKEEIYYGKYLDRAPDLILLSNPGFSLRGNIGKGEIFTKGIFSGMHTQDDAFLFVKNKKNKNLIPDNPKVSDIVGILNKLKTV